MENTLNYTPKSCFEDFEMENNLHNDKTFKVFVIYKYVKVALQEINSEYWSTMMNTNKQSFLIHV